MPLQLSVRIGQSVAIGGPTTLRVEHKSGQEVRLVFDADRSVPIRIIEPSASAPAAAGAPGLGLSQSDSPTAPGLGHNQRRNPSPAHDGPAQNGDHGS